MVSIPSSAADTPVEGSEKPPQTAHESETTQNVQYDERTGLKLDQEASSRKESGRRVWRKSREGQMSNWWFASTGIPLLAATLGPLANISSICALVTSWRSNVQVEGLIVSDFDGIPFADPTWCYWLNVASLICGFLGNLFLLLNFTQRIRYIIALPLTIILWYFATGFLIGITACMQIYARPDRPNETYTQGFWYAVAAAAFYLICSMILMINMLGYFLGHYPDTFALTDAQRTLILQTMFFFIWLGGGAAAFSRIESDERELGWSFADALYFCDVTILTVGFGDLYPTTDLARGLVFPYSVGGIIMLGLVISSIYKFMKQLGEDHIIQAHIDRMRERTVKRTVNNSFDLRKREHDAHRLIRRHPYSKKSQISGPSNRRAYRTAIGETIPKVRHATLAIPLRKKQPRLLLLREEKDRFEAMRAIQAQTHKFKKWYALTFSILAFGILWCVGAVVFWHTEKDAQNMTYFRALYFCYVSLLTTGYGDLSPKTNAGRCFFVIWSLIAVPTMTILVSDMGDTVIHKFKTWSSELADFTVLPKEGIWRSFLEKHPWLLNWLQKRVANRQAKKRLKDGFGTMNPDSAIVNIDADLDNTENRLPRTASRSTAEDPEAAPFSNPLTSTTIHTDTTTQPIHLTPLTLQTHLALSIRVVAMDMQLPAPKRYCYEEWVEFTRLLRYASFHGNEKEVSKEEEEDGLVDWDWIGEDSPLISGGGESEWLLGRLTEALVRVERRGVRGLRNKKSKDWRFRGRTTSSRRIQQAERTTEPTSMDREQGNVLSDELRKEDDQMEDELNLEQAKVEDEGLGHHPESAGKRDEYVKHHVEIATHPSEEQSRFERKLRGSKNPSVGP
ncbi:voltage-gated potassium channel [Pleomassaria siparia CBS 279.74]|uniref:Voltage-gated potassium channel n=1 Tax=Pleomassaria siparia CBS 279.74 TaxID=1314801 RepID=A0A6G1KLL1_9PLEO|nr:voltage-gated potassium channel [Pleomassaria siparia CBS 279.74]